MNCHSLIRLSIASFLTKTWKNLRVQWNTNQKKKNTTWKFYQDMQFLESEPTQEKDANRTSFDEDSAFAIDETSREVNDNVGESDSQFFIIRSLTNTPTASQNRIVVQTPLIPQDLEDSNFGREQEQEQQLQNEEHNCNDKYKEMEKELMKRIEQRNRDSSSLQEICSALKSSTNPFVGGLLFGLKCLENVPTKVAQNLIGEFIRKCLETSAAYHRDDDD